MMSLAATTTTEKNYAFCHLIGALEFESTWQTQDVGPDSHLQETFWALDYARMESQDYM